MLISDIPVMSAHHHPERVAIRYQDRAMTFRELRDRTHRLSQALMGIAAPGDRIAILAENCCRTATSSPRCSTERVVAVVQARSGSSVSQDEVIAFCRERLAGYKKPRHVVFAGELPKNASGKILKRELRDRLRSEPFPATP